MRFRFPRIELAIAVAAFAAVASQPAQAVLELPGGDTLLNGAFDDIKYGSTGNAFVTPLLFVGELGGTESPESIDLVTDLRHDYVMDGLGTSLLTITYSIRNDGVDPFTDSALHAERAAGWNRELQRLRRSGVRAGLTRGSRRVPGRRLQRRSADVAARRERRRRRLERLWRRRVRRRSRAAVGTSRSSLRASSGRSSSRSPTTSRSCRRDSCARTRRS